MDIVFLPCYCRSGIFGGCVISPCKNSKTAALQHCSMKKLSALCDIQFSANSSAVLRFLVSSLSCKRPIAADMSHEIDHFAIHAVQVQNMAI